MSTVDPAVFHATVYEIARMIPHGMVTSYGHLARLAGSPAREISNKDPDRSIAFDNLFRYLSSDSRLVGQAMKFLQADDVPWQRVISSSGAISDRGDGGQGARRQADRLRQEGVEVSESGTPTKFRVNMAHYGWYPALWPVPDSVYLGPDEEAEE